MTVNLAAYFSSVAAATAARATFVAGTGASDATASTGMCLSAADAGAS